MDEKVVPLIPNIDQTEELCTNIKRLVREELQAVSKDATVCRSNQDGAFLSNMEPVKIDKKRRLESFATFFSKSVVEKNIDGHALEEDATRQVQPLNILITEDLVPNDEITCREIPLWASRIAGLNKKKRTTSPIQCKQTDKHPKKASASPTCEPITRAPRQTSTSKLMGLQCIPSKVIFCNYNVGEEYNKAVRLMNVTKSFLKFTVLPPRDFPIYLHLKGRINGGLTVGRHATLEIKFIPKHSKPIKTEAVVKDSYGGLQSIYIICELQSLMLHMTSRGTDLIELPNECKCINKYRSIIHMGTCLLGDTIRFDFTFHSDKKRGTFFILTEDEWEEKTLKSHVSNGYFISKPFIIYPAYFSGRGKVNATIWFIPSCCEGIKTYSRTFVILASNFIARRLAVTADVLLFEPQNVYILNQEKCYDIESDTDLKCEYYIDLGVAYYGRSLSNILTVQNDRKIKNFSLVNYKCYWKLRPWNYQADDDCWNKVTIIPSSNMLVANSASQFQVTVEDVGNQNNDFRCVAMLILEKISLSSVPHNFDVERVPFTESLSEVPVLPTYQQCHCHLFSDIVYAEIEIGWRVEDIFVIVEPKCVIIPRHKKHICSDLRLAGGVSFISVESCLCDNFNTSGLLNLNARVTNCGSKNNLVLKCQWQGPALFVEDKSPPPIFSLYPTEEKLESLCLNTSKCHDKEEIILNVNDGEFQAAIVIILTDKPKETITLSELNLHNAITIGGFKTEYSFFVTNHTTTTAPFKIKAYQETFRGKDDYYDQVGEAYTPTYKALLYKEKRELKYEMEASDEPSLKIHILRLNENDDTPVKMQALLFSVRSTLPVVDLSIPVNSSVENDDHASKEYIVELDPGPINKDRTLLMRCTRPLIVGQTYNFDIVLTNYSAVSCYFKWQEQLFNAIDSLSVKFMPVEGTVESYERFTLNVELVPLNVWNRRLSLRECQLELLDKPLNLLIETESLAEKPTPLPCLL